MITYIVFFLLYSLILFILRKYNISGWKGRIYASVMTLLLMLASITVLKMTGVKNHSEQAVTGTLDNKYYSIKVPNGYEGGVINQYEPAGYSVGFAKNNTAVFITAINYDTSESCIENHLIDFISSNPQIAGKLNEIPTFNKCTILGQHAFETQIMLPDNMVTAISFRAKNGMLYQSIAFNLSLEEHKQIIETINIKETKVEYIDTETFFRTCYHGLEFKVNEYIDESILLESYELNPQNKELYINIKLVSISESDIDKELLEAFKSDIIDYQKQSIHIVYNSAKEGYNVICKLKFEM